MNSSRSTFFDSSFRVPSGRPFSLVWILSTSAFSRSSHRNFVSPFILLPPCLFRRCMSSCFIPLTSRTTLIWAGSSTPYTQCMYFSHRASRAFLKFLADEDAFGGDFTRPACAPHLRNWHSVRDSLRFFANSRAGFPTVKFRCARWALSRFPASIKLATSERWPESSLKSQGIAGRRAFASLSASSRQD